jgi:methionyl aminopeptidase
LNHPQEAELPIKKELGSLNLMITIKTEEEIKIMKEGGKILAGIMAEISAKVKPGIATQDLEEVALELIAKHKTKPSFKGYKGGAGLEGKPYPSALCISINEELVHCVPSQRILKEGDIVSLDSGILYNGFHSDMAITVPVGNVPLEAHRLIVATKKALKRGISKALVGNTFGDVANAIQRHIEGQGFSVIEEFCGHGIGRNLHEDPQIPNYGKRGEGEEIKEGMVFCLEPMASIGDWKTKKAKDGFGYQMADNSLSAHFEHTIAITKTGNQVLTEL